MITAICLLILKIIYTFVTPALHFPGSMRSGIIFAIVLFLAIFQDLMVIVKMADSLKG